MVGGSRSISLVVSMGSGFFHPLRSSTAPDNLDRCPHNGCAPCSYSSLRISLTPFCVEGPYDGLQCPCYIRELSSDNSSPLQVHRNPSYDFWELNVPRMTAFGSVKAGAAGTTRKTLTSYFCLSLRSAIITPT